VLVKAHAGLWQIALQDASSCDAPFEDLSRKLLLQVADGFSDRLQFGLHSLEAGQDVRNRIAGGTSVLNTTAIGQWSDRFAWPPGSTVVNSNCSKLPGRTSAVPRVSATIHAGARLAFGVLGEIRVAVVEISPRVVVRDVEALVEIPEHVPSAARIQAGAGSVAFGELTGAILIVVTPSTARSSRLLVL
jgi:hypothetical protein